MPQPSIINGKSEILPGVYSQIKSGVKNPAPQISSGNALIIDTGLGAGYVGGAGVDGTSVNGLAAAQTFSTLRDYHQSVSGGPLWVIGRALFHPAGLNSQIKGAPSVTVIKAATTSQGVFNYTLANQFVTISTVDEGTAVNGVLASGNLAQGYAVKMLASLTTAGFYNLYFYKGTYKGSDPINGNAYDNIPAASCPPLLVAKSDDFQTIDQLLAWSSRNIDFKRFFKISAPSDSTTIPNSDLTAMAGLKLIAGGTESYSSSALLDRVLDVIDDLDFTHILALDSNSNAVSVNNLKLLDFVLQRSKYGRFLWIGGGGDSTQFSGSTGTSVESAKTLNSKQAFLVHGNVKQYDAVSGILKTRDTFFHAAMLMGRACGLEPQTPLTFKQIDLQGLVHNLNKRQKETALKYGVMSTVYDSDLMYIILHDQNTVQANDFLIPENGQTYSGSLARIEAQLNKEIIISGKLRFFAGEKGPNRNTVSEPEVLEWLKVFLASKTASAQNDNLILESRNYAVSYDGDRVFFSYRFIPNLPVRMIIATGTMVEKFS